MSIKKIPDTIINQGVKNEVIDNSAFDEEEIMKCSPSRKGKTYKVLTKMAEKLSNDQNVFVVIRFADSAGRFTWRLSDFDIKAEVKSEMKRGDSKVIEIGLKK
ncbi:MAG: hypothetical protein SGI89_00395 [bacterium]|nr:hypothetical protein [bacterium]